VIVDEYWQHVLRTSPTWATALGDHRYDDRLPDESAEGLAADRVVRAGLLARADALPEPTGEDATTLALLRWELRTRAAVDATRPEEWAFSATENPIASFLYLPELHPAGHAATLAARYAAIPAAIDATIANLRRGLASGRVVTRTSAERVFAQADGVLAAGIGTGPLARPDAPDLSAIEAAFGRWRDFVRDEVVPAARPDDRAGVGWLPDGEAIYAAGIARHTTLDLGAAAIHTTGRDELARIHERIAVLGERVLGTADRAAIIARLRSDPALHFDSADAIEATARDALARAEAAVPRWFGRLPRTPCVVRRVPEHEAPFTYIAYYRQPHPGSKPGEYFVNTYQPQTRTRYEALVLAYHESVPGHHLQIALGQELADLPAFRRNFEPTAYLEGWALYSEGLADEMGLYPGDLDRLGAAMFDAWRASRLVVDTGLHAFGWSRERAVAFLVDNAGLTDNNAANEVDRYIGWPGQALGYKLGHLAIVGLRREAEAVMGERFDIRRFHDAVLCGGAVTLPVLEARVRSAMV
jgi:uncharacterized protein (DUF885 family)